MFRSDSPVDLSRQLASALATVAEPAAAERLRQAVLARIAGFTYAETAKGLFSAIDFVLKR